MQILRVDDHNDHMFKFIDKIFSIELTLLVLYTLLYYLYKI
jgi:hypothetical protein